MNRIKIVARTLHALPVLFSGWLLAFDAVAAGPPPVVTLQPASQTTVLAGTATFTVAATSGTALTYQWYFQATPITGATNNTHVVADAQFTDAGAYYVVLVNAGGTVTSATAVLTIKNAPLLAGGNALAAINEDDFTNGGTPVSTLIAGQVTDPDPGALQGIAVVGVNNTAGTWQYSTNAGLSWTAFGNPTPNSARLLASNAGTYVRLVPHANWNGLLADAITFRAWDLSSGIAGTTNVAAASGTFLDTFNTVSYANNHGTDRWNGNWSDVDGSPSSGSILVGGGALRIRANNTTDWIYREADLSGVTNAVVSFNYDSDMNAGIGGRIDFQVSRDGGATYTTLATFTATNHTGVGTFSADISAYATLDTRIRFVTVNRSSPTKELDVDNVRIAYLMVGGATAFSANTATSSITVNPVNDAPVTHAQSVSTSEDTVSQITLTASDVDGDLLTFSIISAPTNGVLSGLNPTNGTVLYRPNTNFSGADSFSFRVHDGTTDSAAATVGISLTPLNDAPVANSQNLATSEATALPIALTGSDPENQAITYALVTSPPHGNISGFNTNNGTLTYTPANGYAGTDTFTFMVRDGLMNSIPATVHINVGVVSPPTLIGQMIPGSGFHIEVSSLPNATILIEASTNLVQWQPLLLTNSGAGLVRFIDVDVANYPSRFYRSAQMP